MNLVGAVLAGGASRRMGRDKAMIALGGERLVDRAVRKLAALCPRVVVADRGRNLVTGLSVEDGQGRGPAAGILGVADAFPGADLLVLACDLPSIPEGLLAGLVGLPGDLVLPRTDHGVEPLCAVYRPRSIAALRERVRRERFSLHPLSGEGGLEVTFMEGPDLEPWGLIATLFRNLNSPDDLPPPA